MRTHAAATSLLSSQPKTTICSSKKVGSRKDGLSQTAQGMSRNEYIDSIIPAKSLTGFQHTLNAFLQGCDIRQQVVDLPTEVSSLNSKSGFSTRSCMLIPTLLTVLCLSDLSVCQSIVWSTQPRLCYSCLLLILPACAQYPAKVVNGNQTQLLVD